MEAMRISTVSTSQPSVSCPRCETWFILEPWRRDDGPCLSGRYYCRACIEDDDCGCVGVRDRRVPRLAPLSTERRCREHRRSTVSSSA